MARKLEAIKVISETGKVAFTDDDYNPADYIIDFSLTVSGLDKDSDEDDADDFYCDTEGGEPIGTISGMIFLGEIAEMYTEFDMYTIADDHSSEAEYIADVLGNDENNRYSGYLNRNILCILEYDVNLIKADHKELLNSLRKMIFRIYHVMVDCIIVYPAPLEYEKSETTRFNEELALGIGHRIANGENDDIIFSLTDDQCSYLLGRRIASDVYPEEAKDKRLWSIFESNGYKEIGNSRLLIKEKIKKMK